MVKDYTGWSQERKLKYIKGKGLTPLKVSEWEFNRFVRNIFTFKRLLGHEDALLVLDPPGTAIDLIAFDRHGIGYVVEIKKKVSSKGEAHDIVFQVLYYAAKALRWDYAKLDDLFQKHWEKAGYEPAALGIELRYVHQGFFGLERLLENTDFTVGQRALFLVDKLDQDRLSAACRVVRDAGSFDEFAERMRKRMTQRWRSKLEGLRPTWPRLRETQFFMSRFDFETFAESVKQPERI